VIRKITLAAEKDNVSFAEALAKESAVLSRIGDQMVKIGIIKNSGDVLSFFEKPELYNGLAVKKARELAKKYRSLMGGKSV
jgi:adenylosuccinate lyase